MKRTCTCHRLCPGVGPRANQAGVVLNGRSKLDNFPQNSLVQVLINEVSLWCLSHLAGIHLMRGFYMKDITCVAGAIFEHGCCQRPQKDPWNESVCFGFTRPCSGKNGENTLLLHRAPPRIMLATLAVAGDTILLIHFTCM